MVRLQFKKLPLFRSPFSEPTNRRNTI